MKSRKLNAKDIGLRGEKVRKIAAYKFLLNQVLLEKPDLYLIPKDTVNSVTEGFDLVGWRASDLYFLKKSNKNLPCNHVYHAMVHFLLAKKFGPNLKGRPKFVLLCEAIASLSEFYFNLEVLRLFGATAGELKKAKVVVARAAEIFGEKKAYDLILPLMESETEQQSFNKFREAVLEMFEHYKYLIKMASRRENEKIDFSDYYSLLRKYKYSAIFCHYQLGNNVMYALLNGGRETAAGKEALDGCIKLLKSSSSFIQFLESLSHSSGQYQKAA